MTQAISPYAELVAERDALLLEVEELRKDTARLDWLADPKNTIGHVLLPEKFVLENPHSLRDAIDAVINNETP